MKIKREVLSNFLRKVCMQATEQLDEVLFNFTTNGLEIAGLTATQTVRVDALLKASSFTDYSAIGQIGVQELNNIIKIIDKFDKEVTLVVEGNLLTMSESSKKVEVELIATQFIQSPQPLPEMEHTEVITLKADDLNDFVGDASLNKDFVINIETAPKQTRFFNTGKFKFSKTFETLSATGGTVVAFGVPFINAVKNLKKEVNLSLKSQFPVKIVEKTDDSVISLIIAPRSQE